MEESRTGYTLKIMKVSISFVKDKKVEGNGSRMSDTSDF